MQEELGDRPECMPQDVLEQEPLKERGGRNPALHAAHLHKVEKMSYGEIAIQLCLPVGTVKSRVSRGLKRMKGSVDVRGGDTLAPGVRPNVPRVLTDGMLNALPEPYYTAMDLHHRQQLSYSRIAERLEEPVGTIKSRCSRAVQRIAKMFGEK